MRPERQSRRLLGVTQSKAKMFEYGVPEEHHIRVPRDPAELFTLTIGLLGELAARTNSEDINENYLNELRDNLQFSARFFDAYLQSRLNAELGPYLLLLGAASYYLCDFPGSSLVLAKCLGEECPNLDCFGLEDLLLWLIQKDLSTYFDGYEGLYGEEIDGISQRMIQYFENGNGNEELFEQTKSLREKAYDNGTPRQLLFADVICAVAKKRFENSTWYCLPSYSGITLDQWLYALKKETFIRELWPAQHLLGENGVFRGKSAVVQMPTSAGKTKATEIIIRSAFFSDRTSLAVIVAPFRALCHEIRNSLISAFHDEPVNIDELSDVLQADCEISEFLGRQQVLIVTPEKLLYVLRQTPELAENIGLLIYDEGHQFDNGIRGVTYELLLTSLKAMVPEGVQTVLASAVISNAEEINSWLNPDDGRVVSGTNLLPTFRTVAFASWLDQLGRLEFVTQDNPDNEEFFVPRIIEQHELQLRGRERKRRLFPEKSDGKAVALYLGLKLAINGSVALFCGTKLAASSLCEKAVDAYNRGFPITKPIEFSDQDEIQRLRFLHECNLGTDAVATQSASLGIFAHHGNSPHGIRLAIEYAIKEGLAKFVICTSTLAQGVNLPIRYLIVTSIYQGPERIKIRDFHNLIGRAGRSGMHTEGSIIFADPKIYDKKNDFRNRWRWNQVKELLDPENSEPCASTLLTIFEPLRSDDKEYYIQMDPLELAQTYVENPENLESLASDTALEHADKNFSKEGLEKQIAWKLNIISSIESYLMAHWDDSSSGLLEEDVEILAMGTLAYFLAEDKQKAHILKLFKLLAHNIEMKIPEASKRKAFGRTLFGVLDSIAIAEWVSENIKQLESCENQIEMLSCLWPVLEKYIRNSTFKKCDPAEVLKEVATGWIQGCPFHELFGILIEADARLIAGTQRRLFKLDHIVNICENALAYDSTLILGAVAENIELINPEDNGDLIGNLQELQKRTKYGLPSYSAISLYEMGFSDRVIAMELSSILDATTKSYRRAIITDIRQKEREVRKVLEKYPTYYSERFKNLF